MLPHNPENMEQLKKRFADSISDILDYDDVSSYPVSPKENRRHVFDFEDGLRLIVSRAKMNGKIIFHVSGHCNDKYSATIKNEGLAGLVEDMLLRLAVLNGGKHEGLFRSTISDAGVLHIMYLEEE